MPNPKLILNKLPDLTAEELKRNIAKKPSIYEVFGIVYLVGHKLLDQTQFNFHFDETKYEIEELDKYEIEPDGCISLGIELKLDYDGTTYLIKGLFLGKDEKVYISSIEENDNTPHIFEVFSE